MKKHGKIGAALVALLASTTLMGANALARNLDSPPAALVINHNAIVNYTSNGHVDPGNLAGITAANYHPTIADVTEFIPLIATSPPDGALISFKMIAAPLGRYQYTLLRNFTIGPPATIFASNGQLNNTIGDNGSPPAEDRGGGYLIGLNTGDYNDSGGDATG